MIEPHRPPIPIEDCTPLPERVGLANHADIASPQDTLTPRETCCFGGTIDHRGKAAYSPDEARTR